MAPRLTLWPVAPRACARPSVNAISGRWQLEQEYRPEDDRRFSKNSRRPSATFAPDIGLSSGTAGGGNPGGRCHS